MSGDILARDAAPPAEVTALEAQCRRVDTPCGDGTMAWRIWGEDSGGPPVVLGHGAQGSWMHWLRNIPVLAERHMVIAADLPGHGDSALPETQDHEGISIALATGLKQILGEGGLPVDLLGFSFGGVAFTYLAKFHPEIARRVILIGCGGLDTPHGDVRIGRVRGLEGEKRRAALTANLLGLMLHHEGTVDDFALWQLVTCARHARFDVPGHVLPNKLLLAFPDVHCPVDAIWGEFDRPHPGPAQQEAALRQFKPDADFRVIDGAGHWAMFERPEAFNRTALDMLAR